MLCLIFQALADALYSNTEVECELGGLIQLCLSFVLELLEKVDITESKQGGKDQLWLLCFDGDWAVK